MSLTQLAKLVAQGGTPNTTTFSESALSAIKSCIEERFHKNTLYRARAPQLSFDDDVPFAGLLHTDSPASGPYGGMSLIWFPLKRDQDQPAASLLTFVCGTRGLHPDEQTLTRPGHARWIRALSRHIASKYHLRSWAKPDPADIHQHIPRTVVDGWERFQPVFRKYGTVIYSATEITEDTDPKIAEDVCEHYLAIYARERNWTLLQKHVQRTNELQSQLFTHIFPKTTESTLDHLIKQRRFVILQGPPGTGKTRLTNIIRQRFKDHLTVQFHPAVTYESFVAGLTPNIESDALAFRYRRGSLATAIQKAQQNPTTAFLLIIDEINRADLGKILGEAIYLFEYGHNSEEQQEQRSLALPMAFDDGSSTLSLPKNLYVLGTMNTSDRSIAILDLAVRRRFAFVDCWPDPSVISEQGLSLATTAFDRLLSIFIELASQDAFDMIPGHSYFLAEDTNELLRRFTYELIPLLRVYLRDARLSNCQAELGEYIDWLQRKVDENEQT